MTEKNVYILKDIINTVVASKKEQILIWYCPKCAKHFPQFLSSGTAAICTMCTEPR